MAPSPSAAILRARSMQTASRAARNRSASALAAVSAGAPDRPLASRKHESLVLVSPSTVIMLKVRSTARFSAVRAKAGSSAASVPMKASMVAMFGWIMPDALGHRADAHLAAADLERDRGTPWRACRWS